MSSPITFSGFNSIDFNQILNLEMQQESQPLQALQTQQATLQAQNSAFSTLATKLANLGTASDSLKDASSLSLLTASSSDPGVGVTTTSGTISGTYDVVVNELARAQVTASAATYTDTSTVVATGGKLTLNGPNGAVDVTITGSTTLQQLADQINATANSPATASIVQASPGHYQLVLTGTSTGVANAFTVDTRNLTGGTAPAFTDTNADGLAGNTAADNAQAATDAAFTVNGLAITSSSNTVDNVIPGVTLSLAKKDPTNTVTITVAKDTSAAENAVNGFISAYNNFISFMKDQQTAASNGQPSISRDPLLLGFKESMRSAMMTSYSGGSLTQLAGVGIGFDANGNMTLDTATFDKAMSDSPTDLQTLFSGTTGDGGAFGAISTMLDGYTQSGGLLSSTEDRINQEVSDLGTRMDTMQAALDIRRHSLQQEYTAADLAMTQLKSQSASLGNVGSGISF